MEIELKEISSRSRDKQEDDEEKVRSSVESSSEGGANYASHDDEDEERQEGGDEDGEEATQESYAEGDVVEIDPEEKALLPCFGKGSNLCSHVVVVIIVAVDCFIGGHGGHRDNDTLTKQARPAEDAS